MAGVPERGTFTMVMPRPLLYFCVVSILACSSNSDGQEIADGAVWVLSRADRSVTVIDPQSAAMVRRVNLGFRSDPRDLVSWGGAVWVGNSGGSLQRIDAATYQLTDTVALDHDVWHLSAASHGVYAADGERSVVSRHETDSGAVIAILDPPDRIHAMAAGPDSVAVVVGDRVEVHFYAPGSTTGRVVSAELGGGDMVTGFGSFWIYHPDGRLLRVDPDSAAIEAAIELAPDLYFPGIAIGDDAVWVSVPELEQIIRVSPATNEIVQTITVSGAPDHVAVHGGSVWAVLSQDDAVIRVDPASGVETARVSVDLPIRIVASP
jgi:streptogramin lyase